MTLFYPAQGGLGTVQNIITGSLGNIPAGEFSAAGGIFDWQTLKYPLAMAWIDIAAFASTPTLPCVVELWGLQKNVGVVGANDATDAPATTVQGGAIWLCKIDIAASASRQARGAVFRIDHDMTIYIRNKTDKQITGAGTLVDMWPLSYGINA